MPSSRRTLATSGRTGAGRRPMHLGNRMLDLATEAVKRAPGPFLPDRHRLAYDAMASTSCTICDEVAGRITAPGGAIYDDGLWLVSHHTGPYTDPGELIVKVRRHVESIADLSGPETSAARPCASCGGRRGRRGRSAPSGSTSPRSASACAIFISTSSPARRPSPPAMCSRTSTSAGRTLLRSWGLAANPSPAARAEVAGRIRQDEAWTRLST